MTTRSVPDQKSISSTATDGVVDAERRISLDDCLQYRFPTAYTT
jgi:hypothetical protein